MWFEYHISLHHSQTDYSVSGGRALFEYHISLHHSHDKCARHNRALFEYLYLYIIPQTGGRCSPAASVGLNTIYFYIILKLEDVYQPQIIV